MANSGRKIWSANDVTFAPFNREIQVFGADGDRPSKGSVFSGGGEGSTDGPRRDPTEGNLLGRKPTKEK